MFCRMAKLQRAVTWFQALQNFFTKSCCGLEDKTPKWNRTTLGQSHGNTTQPNIVPQIPTAQEKKERIFFRAFFPKPADQRLESSCARNASKALGLTCPPWILFSEIIFCFWLPLHPVHSLQSTRGLPACCSSPPRPWLFQAEHLQQLKHLFLWQPRLAQSELLGNPHLAPGVAAGMSRAPECVEQTSCLWAG